MVVVVRSNLHFYNIIQEKKNEWNEFTTLSNIYDRAFLRKYLTAFSRQLFLQKHSIIESW